jgi:hypothetical protein
MSPKTITALKWIGGLGALGVATWVFWPKATTPKTDTDDTTKKNFSGVTGSKTRTRHLANTITDNNGNKYTFQGQTTVNGCTGGMLVGPTGKDANGKDIYDCYKNNSIQG